MRGLARLLGPSRGRRWLLPWALGLSALLNLAYPMYRHYDFSHSLDTAATCAWPPAAPTA